MASPLIGWYTIPAAFFHLGDTLFILDASYAGDWAAIDQRHGELMAASTCHSEISNNVDISFTNDPYTSTRNSRPSNDTSTSFTDALCKTLERKAEVSGVTTALLYSAVCSDCWGSESAPDSMPVYVPHYRKPVIGLQPLPDTSAFSSIPSSSSLPNLEQLRALVSVTLYTDFDEFNVGEFRAWLRDNFPSRAFQGRVNVELQSVHRGSLILLMFLPLELWAHVRGLEYVKLVAYVRNGNAALESVL